MPDLPRHVIREHRFERDLRALIPDAPDATLSSRPRSSSFARDALAGQRTAHPPVWALPMTAIGENQIVLYYTFDDSTVWLLSIAIV